MPFQAITKEPQLHAAAPLHTGRPLRESRFTDPASGLAQLGCVVMDVKVLLVIHFQEFRHDTVCDDLRILHGQVHQDDRVLGTAVSGHDIHRPDGRDP